MAIRAPDGANKLSYYAPYSAVVVHSQRGWLGVVGWGANSFGLKNTRMPRVAIHIGLQWWTKLCFSNFFMEHQYIFCTWSIKMSGIQMRSALLDCTRNQMKIKVWQWLFSKVVIDRYTFRSILSKPGVESEVVSNWVLTVHMFHWRLDPWVL